MVTVGVGEPDPADIRWIDDAAQVGQEVAVGQAEPGVHDDRFAGVEHEGVDRQVPDTGDLQVVVQDGDVGADAVVFIVSPKVSDQDVS